jgi:hypothetical protein
MGSDGFQTGIYAHVCIELRIEGTGKLLENGKHFGDVVVSIRPSKNTRAYSTTEDKQKRRNHLWQKSILAAW